MRVPDGLPARPPGGSPIFHQRNPEGLPPYLAVTSQVLFAIFEVSNTLGAGFLQKVYERALLQELHVRGIGAAMQVSFPIHHKGVCVGEYYADILVEDTLLIELKCFETFAPEHMAQCLNCLRASGKHLCLLVNFQKPKVEWRRIIL